MQKGIHVEMATANHARPWPEADNRDAWIVTIDDSGRLYLGADSTTLEELQRWMIQHPRRSEQKLFIKADARASYVSVQKALDAAGGADFTEPVLLLKQQDTAGEPGIVVPPKGVEVAINAAGHNAQAIVVGVLASPNEPVTLTIDHEPVSWDALQGRLRESVQSRNEKSVFVEVDGQAAFAQVARVIDACTAARAKVVLSEATL